MFSKDTHGVHKHSIMHSCVHIHHFISFSLQGWSIPADEETEALRGGHTMICTTKTQAPKCMLPPQTLPTVTSDSRRYGWTCGGVTGEQDSRVLSQLHLGVQTDHSFPPQDHRDHYTDHTVKAGPVGAQVTGNLVLCGGVSTTYGSAPYLGYQAPLYSYRSPSSCPICVPPYPTVPILQGQ